LTNPEGARGLDGVELYREEGSTFRSVRASVSDLEFKIDTQDMGPTTEELWGDGDYEFWTIVPRAGWGLLLAALAEEFLRGDARATDYGSWTEVPSEKQGALLMVFAQEFLADDSRATDRLAEICRTHQVPHAWSSWA
jgi:hypothetical protein